MKMIGAIIILYNPDRKLLDRGLTRILPQVDEVCLVDNSPNNNCSIIMERFKRVSYIPLGENLGIAAAQNIGINYFQEKRFDWVLFSDQDSTLSDGAVHMLKKEHEYLEALCIKVGIVGTRAVNRQTGKKYPSKSKEFGTVVSSDKRGIITECYSVRSSVSLIRIENIQKIGCMDESLFIDGVDHEWCWRAWHKCALRSFIVENAILEHQLGEGDKSLAGKSVAITTPFRIYYQFRNYIWLCKRAYVPRWWKKKHLFKYGVKIIYYPLFVPSRVKYIRSILNGLKDGFLKKQNHEHIQ